MPAPRTGPRKLGVFRQKAVAGMNRVDVLGLGQLDDRLDSSNNCGSARRACPPRRPRRPSSGGWRTGLRGNRSPRSGCRARAPSGKCGSRSRRDWRPSTCGTRSLPKLSLGWRRACGGGLGWGGRHRKQTRHVARPHPFVVTRREFEVIELSTRRLPRPRSGFPACRSDRSWPGYNRPGAGRCPRPSRRPTACRWRSRPRAEA